MNRLAPCPVCRRHLRAVERVCPFCSASFAGRALAVAAIGTSFAIAGCGGNTDPLPADASVDAHTSVDASGLDASVADALTFEDAAADASQPDSGGIALYGAPPPKGSERVRKTE